MRIAIPFATIGLINNDDGVFPDYIRSFLMTAFTLVIQLLLLNISIVTLMTNKLIYGIGIAVVADIWLNQVEIQLTQLVIQLGR